MMSKADFDEAVSRLHRLGWAQGDIEWAEGICEPKTPDDFALETIFVICNSGMKFEIARKIFDKVKVALLAGESAFSVFRHPGKAGAIDRIWKDREYLHRGFLLAADRLEFLAALPWIGQITKYHLAKNFGVDVAKPDVHLDRLAQLHGTTAQLLCEHLARLSNFRVATVDTLIWRACATGVIDSRTGRLAA
ncbi:hypothetical protein [Bosea sp. RAC05]|uniref:hypothetical protein n=1 Tax=Bosea sp. RAC05 TaxID=1842539 RepID=UPI00083CDFEF|nr:hypothetical protein [Bosea sp. RAC05]AOG03436.1 hypothetical protein BSY19_5132 [Bosea sp. RAC05]